jgi:alpha-glucosidase
MGEMYRVEQLHSTDQPEVHGIAAEMRRIANGYEPERVLLGEIYLPLERLMHYYGRQAPGVHLPYNFVLIDAAWNAVGLHALIRDYEAALPRGAWPNWVLGNHDRPRIAARRGEAQARVAAMMLLTLRGTPTIYYGDELGLGHVAIPAERVQDPRELREPGLGLGRDPVRTPMPWDATANAGFTTGEPWLPLNADWRERNAATEDANPNSMLRLHRALLALRRAHAALAIGDIELLEPRGDVLAYVRRHRDERILIALNLGATEQPFHAGTREVLLSTIPGAASPGVLRPNEGVILR